MLALISAISDAMLQNVNSISFSLSRSYIAAWKTVVRLSILQAEQCALVYEFAECAVCMRVHNNYRAANLLTAVKLRVSPRYAAVSAFKSAVRVVQPRQKNMLESQKLRVSTQKWTMRGKEN